MVLRDYEIMRLLAPKYLEYISLIAFFATIPLYLFYNVLISLSIIPPFLGGYFGIVVSMFLIPLLVLSGISNSKAPRHVKYFEFSIYFFCIYIAVWCLWGLANGSHSDIVKGHLASLIYFIVFLNIFKNLNLESKYLKIICFCTAIVYFLYLVFYVASGLFITNLNSEYEFSYQFIGLAILIVGIILLGNVSNWFLSLLVMLTLSSSLFFNGARTELIGFVFFFIANGMVNAKYKLFFTMFYFVVLSIVIGFIYYFKEHLKDNRFIALFDQGVSSGSGFERMKMAENGFDNINSVPIIGRYGEYLPGEYIHNVLALWSDFGLFPFTLFVIIYFFVLIIGLKKIFGRSNISKSEGLYISCALSLLPLLIFAKTFEYILIPVCLGIFIQTQTKLYTQSQLKKTAMV